MNVRSEISAAQAKRGRGRPLVDDKRRIILDAAIRVFGERGFHGTSVPDIASAAGVGTGTLYRYFEHKEGLVNEVFRDAKLRLRAAMLDNAPALDPYDTTSAKRWFTELWRRLGVFAMTEPAAFRFLEMQDHVEYLDHESRQLELSLLGPLFLAGNQILAGKDTAATKQNYKRGRASSTKSTNSTSSASSTTATSSASSTTATSSASSTTATSSASSTIGTTGANHGDVVAHADTGARVDTLIALLWGAFVGLIKASRLGYLTLDDAQLKHAGEAAWQLIAPAR